MTVANNARVSGISPPYTIAEADDPSGLADHGSIYTNDVSGITELMYKDSAGTETQITSAGAVAGSFTGTANRVVITNGSGALASSTAYAINSATITPISAVGTDLGSSSIPFRFIYVGNAAAGAVLIGLNPSTAVPALAMGNRWRPVMSWCLLCGSVWRER